MNVNLNSNNSFDEDIDTNNNEGRSDAKVCQIEMFD